MSFLTSYISANSRNFISGAAVAWANRVPANSVPIGSLQWFDLGSVEPVLMRSDGVNWKITAPCVLINNTVASAGINSTSEQIIKQIVIPGDLLFACNFVSVSHLLSKVGVNGAVQPIQYRLGNAGTLIDSSIYLSNSWNTAAHLSHSGGVLINYGGAAAVNRFVSSINFPIETGGSVVNGYPIQTLVSDLSLDSYLSLTVTALSALDLVSANRFTLLGY